MRGASFFVSGAAWEQTELHRGQKTRAGARLTEVNPPPNTPGTDRQTDRLQFVMQPFIGRTAFLRRFSPICDSPRYVFFCSTYIYVNFSGCAWVI